MTHPTDGAQSKLQPSSEGTATREPEPNARHALDIMLNQWNIQYHTTLGMNTRIGAALAFASVVLGFDLKSATFREGNAIAFVAAVLLLVAIICLLVAVRTRWADRLPSVEQMAAGSVVSAAKSIEGLVQSNHVKLEQKSRWLNIGLSFIGASILVLGIGITYDTLSKSHGIHFGQNVNSTENEQLRPASPPEHVSGQIGGQIAPCPAEPALVAQMRGRSLQDGAIRPQN